MVSKQPSASFNTASRTAAHCFSSFLASSSGVSSGVKFGVLICFTYLELLFFLSLPFFSFRVFFSALGAVQAAGFSLNAAVYISADEGDALERLCRYIARPPISNKRL
ncbi:transposase, partial [Myxococcota bacterium]|nr:transposase [Myxococcota bacterium]